MCCHDFTDQSLEMGDFNRTPQKYLMSIGEFGSVLFFSPRHISYVALDLHLHFRWRGSAPWNLSARQSLDCIQELHASKHTSLLFFIRSKTAFLRPSKPPQPPLPTKPSGPFVSRHCGPCYALGLTEPDPRAL